MSVTAALESVRTMTENLLYAQRTLALRDRIHRLQTAIQKPDVTTADLLRADFGTDQPNGLDIVHLPSRPVRVGVLETAPFVLEMDEEERAKYLKITGGAADGDQIHISSKYLELAKTPYRMKQGALATYTETLNIISHENTHILQGHRPDREWPDVESRLCSTLSSTPLGTGIMAHMVSYYMRMKQYGSDTTAQRETGIGIPTYFAKKEEIEARMHEIMATGYTQWKKMPTTETELHAALYNAGVETPLQVKWKLMTSVEGLKALVQFRCSPDVRAAVQDRVSNINRVLDYAALPSRRAGMWSKVFPEIYGHLLELYGDGPGRARMGLGTNPAPALDALQATKEEILDAVRAKALAAAVPPDCANTLFNALVSGEQKFTENQHLLAAALLERPETRTAILEKHSALSVVTRDDYAFQWAVLAGHAEAVTMLLDAGYDPVRPRLVRDFEGTEFQVWRISDTHKYALQLEEINAAESKGISKPFNDASYVDWVRKAVANNDRAYQGMLRHYDAKGADSIPEELRPLLDGVRDRLARKAVPAADIAAPGQAVAV